MASGQCFLADWPITTHSGYQAMGIRTYKPTSAGRRNSSVSDFSELTDKNKKPEKSLTEPLKKTGGRNNQGFITARHRGGGHKRKYRIIDFRRNDHDGRGRGHPHRVRPEPLGPDRPDRLRRRREAVHPGPGRPEGRDDRHQRPGRRAQAGQLPAAGQDPHRAVDPQHRDAARRRRQALPLGGRRRGPDRPRRDWAQITLPSGEVRRIPAACRATIGMVGNPDHMNVRLGKAGRTRWLGRRPHVRGVAMNPVDHPMGGGEGRSGGRIPARRPACWPRAARPAAAASRRTRPSSAADQRPVRAAEDLVA